MQPIVLNPWNPPTWKILWLILSSLLLLWVLITSFMIYFKQKSGMQLQNSESPGEEPQQKYAKGLYNPNYKCKIWHLTGHLTALETVMLPEHNAQLGADSGQKRLLEQLFVD